MTAPFNSKNLNRIKTEVGVSFKCGGRWSRNTPDWIKDQGTDKLVEVEILAGDRLLWGLRNVRTRAILWKGMRRATPGDHVRANVRRFVKRAPMFVRPEDLGLVGGF